MRGTRNCEREATLKQLNLRHVSEANKCTLVYESKFNVPYMFIGSRNSSVGIATRYGLNVPGIESRWGGEIFHNRPDRSWGPPSLLYNGYRVSPGGKAAKEWR